MRSLQSFLRILKDILNRLLDVLTKSLFKPCHNENEQVGIAKVQVYILMGQSNMLGEGKVHGNKDGTLEYAVMTKGLYPYLIDKEKIWMTSKTVRNVRVMDGRDGKMHVYNNEFLNPSRSNTIGPEVGIGSMLEKASDAPILLLKSCIGNRSLGWDLLPPGSTRYNYKDRTYAGYKDCPAYWDKGTPKPDPTVDWYAGKQYDTDIANAKCVLSELEKYYPNASSYEIAGFFWWQGDKDRYDESYATFYERNLTSMIGHLRTEFAAPNAKFVLATLGQTDKDNANGNDELLLDAMLAVDGNSGKHPEFRGNVATVYSHPHSKGGSSNGHYDGNAETYQNVGEAMGNTMAELNNNGALAKMEASIIV